MHLWREKGLYGPCLSMRGVGGSVQCSEAGCDARGECRSRQSPRDRPFFDRVRGIRTRIDPQARHPRASLFAWWIDSRVFVPPPLPGVPAGIVYASREAGCPCYGLKREGFA